MEQVKLGDTVLRLVLGDITNQNVDAVVNAANTHLAGGGGVDGAIHRAGGAEVMAECRKIGGCPTGQAVITMGGNLPAKNVIHTVGPIYERQSNSAEPLSSCYANSLRLAREHGLRSLAFPSISTGVYGYPVDEAAEVALGTIIREINEHPEAFDDVRMVLFSKDDLDVYSAVLDKLHPNP